MTLESPAFRHGEYVNSPDAWLQVVKALKEQNVSVSIEFHPGENSVAVSTSNKSKPIKIPFDEDPGRAICEADLIIQARHI